MQACTIAPDENLYISKAPWPDQTDNYMNTEGRIPTEQYTVESDELVLYRVLAEIRRRSGLSSRSYLGPRS